MNREQVDHLLQRASRDLLDTDAYLFEANVNERSLTHKFAEYLQAAVGPEWSVDCEYNRYGNDTKKVEEVKDLVGWEVATDETKSRTVYPDIIVHKRGPAGPNLLVIEAKKNASEGDYKIDWMKLERIKDQFGYSFAAFINFVTGGPDVEYELTE
jgi:hypothetical protein